MFLVVFVTLVISIIGLYAQIISVQSARLSANQFALMQTMTAWHAGALQLAHNLAPGTTFPCRITNASYYTDSNPICLDINGNDLSGVGYLPSNYSFKNYSFYTIEYLDTTVAPNTNYVITAAFNTDAAGFLHLPDSTGPSSGYTLDDLAVQFNRAPRSNLAYGSVDAGGNLVILTNGPGAEYANITYTGIPAPITPGAIAVISAAQ